MPKIPVASPSSIRMSTQYPGAQIDPEASATSGKITSALGQAAVEVKDVFERAVTISQKTKAQNTLSARLAEIESAAATDTDYSTEKRKKYDDQITKARQDAVGMIGLPQEQQLFSMEAESQAAVSGIKVKTVFTRKAIDAGRAEMELFFNNSKNQYLSGDADAIKKRNIKLEEAVNAGLISREDAAQRSIALDKEWSSDKIFHDITIAPEEVLAELEKGEKGVYGKVPIDIRDEYKNKAKIAVKNIANENEGMQTAARVRGRFETIAKIVDGSIDWRNANDAIYAIAEQDPDLAEAMKKALASPDNYMVEDFNNQSFQELAVEIFKAKDAESVSKFLVQALNDHKNISKDRLAILIDAAREKAKEVPLKMKDAQAKQSKSFWAGAMDLIRETLASSGIRGMSEAMASTITRAKQEGAQGEKITAIANDEIRKQRLKDRPEIASLPPEGRLYTDKYGTRFIQYPDGSTALVQKKGGEFIHKESRKKE